MARRWTLILTEEDAKQYEGEIVAFQTNLEYFGVNVDGTTCLWSETPDNAPEDNVFYGYVFAGHGDGLSLHPLIKPEADDKWRVLSTAVINEQLNNPDYYNDGHGPFLQMRKATRDEISAASLAVRHECARPDNDVEPFYSALGLY